MFQILRNKKFKQIEEKDSISGRKIREIRKISIQSHEESRCVINTNVL